MNARYFGLIARIAILVVMIEIAALGVIGAFYSGRFSHLVEEDIHSRLKLVARMIGQEELPVSVISSGRLISDFVGAPYEGGMLIGGNGRVVVSLDPSVLGRAVAELPAPLGGWLTGEVEDRLTAAGDHLTYVAKVPASVDGAPLYTLSMTVNIADLNGKKRFIAWLGIGLSGLFVLLSSVAIILVAQRLITRRVDQSLAVLKRIENGDMDARITVSVADEIGQLQNGVNSMTSTISRLLTQHRCNEEEITAILDSITDGVIAVGLSGEIIRCNPSAARFFTRRKDQAWSPSGGYLADLLPSLVDCLPPSWYCSQNSLTPDAGVPLRLSLRGGDVKYIDLGHGPIVEQDGSVLGGVLVLHDISERIAAENQLREVVERLTVSNTELERFAYVASHDLQEPLRTIVSFTQLLERRWADQLSGEAREYSQYVIDAAKHMRLLINDLLAFSQVNSKAHPNEPVSLTDACDVALQNLHESILECAANIDIGPLPEVIGDKMQMIQLFQNLLGNALKFRRPNTRPSIRVMSSENNGIWTVSVWDDGIGIGETKQDIFEIFNRLHAKAAYPGSGVGLAICKRIVHRHGGRIWYESQAGQGTTFYFTLPIQGASGG